MFTNIRLSTDDTADGRTDLDFQIIDCRIITEKFFVFSEKVCKGCYMTLFLLVSKSSLKYFSFKRLF